MNLISEELTSELWNTFYDRGVYKDGRKKRKTILCMEYAINH